MEPKQIEYMKVEDIKVSPFNPAGRVSDHALKDLFDQIRDAGAVLQPLVLDADGILADGHRRLECAKILGLQTVPVIRQDGFTSVDLWRNLNSGTRKMSGLDVFQAILIHNAPLEVIPAYFEVPIQWLITHLGMDLARELAEKNYSPSGIQKTISSVMRYCKKTEDEFAQFVARWIIDQRQAYSVRKAMEAHVKPEDIIDAINSNRKLVKVWQLSD